MDLVIRLRPCLEAWLEAAFSPEELGLRATLGAWPACPDLLVGPDAKYLIGITYQVPPDYLELAESFGRANSPAIRIDRDSAENSKQPYQHESSAVTFFEIRWSPLQATAVKEAQLTEAFWLFRGNQELVQDGTELWGFVIADIGRILDSYDVQIRIDWTD